MKKLIFAFCCAICIVSCEMPPPIPEENPVVFSGKAQSKYVSVVNLKKIDEIDDLYDSNLDDLGRTVIKNDWITFTFDPNSRNSVFIEVAENTTGEYRKAQVKLVDDNFSRAQVMLPNDNMTRMSMAASVVLEVIQEP